MSTIIHPTWERDFIKGLLLRRRRVLSKQQTKQKNTNKNENDKNDVSSSLSSSSISSPSSSSNKQPYIVGLVGMPGSGKTTSGKILCDLLNENNKNDKNERKEDNNDAAVVLPMDGYHYSLERLTSMNTNYPNKDFIYRRGAPDTFDVTALKNDLHQIKYGNERSGLLSTTIDATTYDPSNVNDTTDSATASSSSMMRIVRIPGFDHANGDPIPNVHLFDRNKHTIVIMEGLYLLHQDDNDNSWNNWNGVTTYFDETIYIDIELNICMERLKKRNLCLPGYTTPEEIYQRVDIVDHQNALLVQHTKHRADTIVIGYTT